MTMGGNEVDGSRSRILRRLLQAVLAAVAAVALVTGAWGLLGSIPGDYDVRVDPGNAGNVMLDTNVRFFSGVWLGIGLALVVVLRAVERQVTLLRMIAVVVFLGGVGRVVSMARLGTPSALFSAFAVAELAFPFLLPLQARIRDDGSRAVATRTAA